MEAQSAAASVRSWLGWAVARSETISVCQRAIKHWRHAAAASALRAWQAAAVWQSSARVLLSSCLIKLRQQVQTSVEPTRHLLPCAKPYQMQSRIELTDAW